MPRHKHYGRQRLLNDYPYIDPDRLLGGFRYGDCQEDDARMVMTVVAAAQAAGAQTANRVDVEKILMHDGAACGASVRDGISGERFELHAAAVVNAAGPWARQLLGAQAPKVRLIKGTHLILPAIAGNRNAFLLTANDGRVFFVIPWYGRTLVGTTEKELTDPAEAVPTADEISYLIAGVKSGLPGLGWTEADVIGAFSGVRTLQAEDTNNLAAVSREFDVVEPLPRLIMPVGGKFTTSRCDAVEIVDAVYRSLNRKPPPSSTHVHTLPGAPDGEFEPWQAGAMKALGGFGVDAESAQWLTLRHGNRVARIIDLLQEHPEWRQRIHAEAPFIRAEAILAIRDEMALSLDDVIRRRMPLSLLVQGAANWQTEIAELVAAEMLRIGKS